MTMTIDVANGTNIKGTAVRVESSSISAIATAPPTAPATVSHRAGDFAVGFCVGKTNGAC
jgi:hypothetical protein